MNKDNSNDFLGAKRHLDRKGLNSALGDKAVAPILTTADRMDVQRKAFLQALAHLCTASQDAGLSNSMIIECLKGAVEGMERV